MAHDSADRTRAQIINPLGRGTASSHRTSWVLRGLWNCREPRDIFFSMSSGWSVHVKVTTREGVTSSQTYYARVPDRLAAAEAVRRHLGAPAGAVIEARKPVQSSVFEALDIDAGQVAQWVNHQAP